MRANLKIGFLGAGKMATAPAKGFVNAGLVKGEATEFVFWKVEVVPHLLHRWRD